MEKGALLDLLEAGMSKRGIIGPAALDPSIGAWLIVFCFYGAAAQNEKGFFFCYSLCAMCHVALVRFLLNGFNSLPWKKARC